MFCGSGRSVVADVEDVRTFLVEVLRCLFAEPHGVFVARRPGRRGDEKSSRIDVPHRTDHALVVDPLRDRIDVRVDRNAVGRRFDVE